VLSSPFRSPPPDETTRDRLHRVLAPSTPDTVEPMPSEPPGPRRRDAPPAVAPQPQIVPPPPFLDLFPDDLRPPPHRLDTPDIDPVAPRARPGRDTSGLGPREASPGHGAWAAGRSPEWPGQGAAGSALLGPDGADSGTPSALPGRAAFDPGRRGMRALAAVAALVVAVAAYLAWQARPSVEPAPDPVPETVASTRPSAPASAAMLVVAVTGRVRRPGLVRLPPGARVADAIEAAGGVLPDTDLSTVNLARKVTDGELVAVAVPGAPAAADAAPGAGSGPVNLNTATLAQLDALPGVGPVLAQRILDHRTRHGDFRSVGDLRQVEGIGEAKFTQLKDLVTV
jgi:competence protein ComEA